MNSSVPPTVESVSLSLETLLLTQDTNTRSEANRWLSEVFRPSPEAWDISLQLLESGRTLSQDIQIFAAQTLFTKLSDHIEEIFGDPNRCLQVCRFLTAQCLLAPLSQQPTQPQFSKPVRLRLSECLGVTVVAFLGAHWTTALNDILNASQLNSNSWSTPTTGHLIVALNLLHAIGALPELLTSLEYKKCLMYLLGHQQYTSWTKTTAAKTLKNESGLISETIASILDTTLNMVHSKNQRDDCEKTSLAIEVIHEALTAITKWSKAFDSPLIMESKKFLDPQLIWKLLVVYGDSRDPALPELFGATIPNLKLMIPSELPQSTPPNSRKMSPPCPSLMSELFTLESSEGARAIIEPLLLFFFQKLFTPLSVICEGNHPPSLERIGIFHKQLRETEMNQNQGLDCVI